MKNSLLLVFFALCFVSGCSTLDNIYENSKSTTPTPPPAKEEYPEYKTNNYYDKFENYEIVELIQNCVMEEKHSGTHYEYTACGNIYFNIRKFVSESKSKNYYLKIIYADDTWMFVEADDGLILLVDGKNDILSAVVVKRDAEGRGITEIATYEATKEFLKTLAHAKKIELKLQGSKHFVTAELSPKNIANIKRFYDEHVSEKK